MRYRRLRILVFAALLAALTAIHCIPTEAQADRRRRPWTTYVSASDRFELECDMTSDTCSDGRTITTTRSTPVPCEVSPGVWEMVPEDTGCYSVRGLESWAANTSYLAYGAELVNAAWSGDATVLPLGNVSWVFGAGDSSIGQTIGSASSGDWTFTCIMRASDTTVGHTARISVGEASCDAELNPSHNSTGVGWGTYSCSTELEEEGPLTAKIWPQSMDGVDVIGCWLTRSDTPGRACWGGAAPVTCAADRHTISTEGWPTESGEICVVASITERLPTAPQYFFDGRIASSSVAARLFISSRSGAPLVLAYGPDQVVVTSDLEWEEAKDYSICVRRDAVSGTVSLLRNGVVVGAASAPPLPWLESVHLGSAFSASVSQFLDGSLRSLRIRSAE